MRTVAVVDHDPEWVRLFEQEARSIERALGSCLVRVHHIGSTAVPGLAAKPVIDILIEVVGLESLERRYGPVLELGYCARGENGLPGRRYFTKGGERRTHQLHGFQVDDEQVGRHLAFRDYLRQHPAVRDEYAAVKHATILACGGSSSTYAALKEPFIQRHQAKALAAWRATP
ncbi:GrpB family protein [Pseudomonas solani]|uniref:GrpB family protein n=1 Tax=Pseudomonas solani TaxID=2731552 RepID=UPI003C2AC076